MASKMQKKPAIKSALIFAISLHKISPIILLSYRRCFNSLFFVCFQQQPLRLQIALAHQLGALAHWLDLLKLAPSELLWLSLQLRLELFAVNPTALCIADPSEQLQ